MSAPLLELKNITKRFPGVLALEDVSVTVGRGEVVALIGENGAGKSTLMNILGGVHQADAGEIRFDGRPVAIRNVADALSLGIGFIHQELYVLDNLDVAANVFLGREPVWGGPLRLIDRGRMVRESEVYLKRSGLAIPPQMPLRELSPAQRQMVEIAKALSQNARLIIMDEPTSSLTLSETERLLATVCDLSEHGVSVIYISHRLGEIEYCADRVVALRDGRNAGELSAGEVSHDKMVSLMIGRKLEDHYVHGKGPQPPAYFRVEDMRTRYRPRHRPGDPGPAVSALRDRAQGDRPGARPSAGPPGRHGSRRRHVGQCGRRSRRLLLFPAPLAHFRSVRRRCPRLGLRFEQIREHRRHGQRLSHLLFRMVQESSAVAGKQGNRPFSSGWTCRCDARSRDNL